MTEGLLKWNKQCARRIKARAEHKHWQCVKPASQARKVGQGGQAFQITVNSENEVLTWQGR